VKGYKIGDIMKKAVIYSRYSDGSKQTSQSIEGQLMVCREFANREGYQIVDEYSDEKISGRTAEKRTEFQRMIADSARGRWQYVIVYQLDRFSRDKYDNAHYKQKLSRNGVKVISARECISDDASGILLEMMLEGMAAYYSEELSQKIQRGQEINASKYLSLGSNPGLGYKVVDKKIVIDESSAYYVVKIFELYASGATQKEVVDHMNSLGVKTSQGNKFSRTSLEHILRNKRYIGTYSYKGEETPNVLPQIVSHTLFDRVQKRLIDNIGSGGRGKAVETYILSGRIFCLHCMSNMVGYGGTGKKGKYYSYYKEKTTTCKSLKVAKQEIEDKVIDVVLDTVMTEDNQRIIASEISTLCEKEQFNPNLKRLQRLVKELNTQKANLLESLKVGKASATAANYVFSEIDRIDKEISELEYNIAVEADKHYGLSEVDIMYFLSHLKKQCGDLGSIENRKLLVNALVNSVFVYDDDKKVTIIFNVSNQPPVQIDTALIDDIIKHNACSNTSESVPPFAP